MNATQACKCPVESLKMRCNVEDRGPFRIARNVQLVCQQCGAEFNVQSIGSDNSLLLRNAPVPERKKPQPPAKPKPKPAAAPKPPSQEELKRVEVYSRLVGEWTAAGGSVPAHVGAHAIGNLAQLKPNVTLLAIGSDVGLLGLALDQTAEAGPHAVVADSETAARLAPMVTRCHVHAHDWRPDYGTLYTGIVLAGEVSPEWLEAIPTLLKPAGDCWLIGAAKQHEAFLSERWGYKSVGLARDTAEEYLWFLGSSAPLEPGLPGTNLHDDLAHRGMAECQTCRKLAHQMNAWGVAGCREHFDEIAEDILPRARAWWANTDNRQKLSAWWKGDARLWSAFTTGASIAIHNRDDMLRVVIRQRVTAAIDAAADRGIG